MTSALAWITADLWALALELAGTITLSHVTVGTYDPATGTSSQTPDDGHVCRGFLTRWRGGPIDGEAVQNGDLACAIPAGQLDQNGQPVPPPVVGDRVSVPDGRSYTVVDANPIGPTGQPVVWLAQVRK